MAGMMSAVPICEYEKLVLRHNNLSFLPVEQRGKPHNGCARRLKLGGGQAPKGACVLTARHGRRRYGTVFLGWGRAPALSDMCRTMWR